MVTRPVICISHSNLWGDHHLEHQRQGGWCRGQETWEDGYATGSCAWGIVQWRHGHRGRRLVHKPKDKLVGARCRGLGSGSGEGVGRSYHRFRMLIATESHSLYSEAVVEGGSAREEKHAIGRGRGGIRCQRVYHIRGREGGCRNAPKGG